MSKHPVRAPEGLASNSATEIVEKLTVALAETAVTQMKAQNFHWNVTGLAFGPLHDLFGKIYTEHFTAFDEVAERVKALGGHAEGRFAEYLKISSVKESDGRLSSTDMIAALRDDQRKLSATFRQLAEIAEKHDDMVTNDMAIARAEAHDKFAWMLGAHLEG
jgi:starvation-inducible DNA-binding protein